MTTELLMERAAKLLEPVDSLRLIDGRYWYRAGQTEAVILDLLEKQEILLGAICSFVRGVEKTEASDPIRARLCVHLSRHKQALGQLKDQEPSLVAESETSLTKILIDHLEEAIRWHLSDSWHYSDIPRERKVWEDRMSKLRNQLVAISELSPTLEIPVDEETCAHCGEVTPMTTVVGHCQLCGARILACSACTQAHCDGCDEIGSHFCERLD